MFLYSAVLKGWITTDSTVAGNMRTFCTLILNTNLHYISGHIGNCTPSFLSANYLELMWDSFGGSERANFVFFIVFAFFFIFLGPGRRVAAAFVYRRRISRPSCRRRLHRWPYPQVIRTGGGGVGAWIIGICRRPLSPGNEICQEPCQARGMVRCPGRTYMGPYVWH